ncbi:SH3 domain-containing protein [Olleya namhaensis]|uniref:SH3 domain-containing protein n=1 Tax=Olleya namhaensis TaxID=1144750 RepID=UPI0024939221|nr:SH3 domain-containing protein [Olleya namhaensis]
MKKKIFTILMFMHLNVLFCQNKEVEILEKIKEELVIKKNQINDSIKKIDIKINYLNSKNENKITENLIFIETTTRSDAKIRNKAASFGDIIGDIPKGQKVKVYDFVDSYWLIEKDSLKGYTSEMYLFENYEMKKLKKKHDKNEITKKYGESIANKILNHRVWIGMTPDMARLSIGNPLKISKSTGTWGVHEQWIYKNKYLYFEKGKLTSWQD